MNLNQIAKVCHQANKAFCDVHDDKSQVEWEKCPDCQYNSAINGVKFRIENPDCGHDAMHNNWMAEKIADGWVYGPNKDAIKQTHPCIVPFDQLPEFQQKKDKLFSAIVDALK